LTEYQLIEECRGGNLKNFRELVSLTAPAAFSVAFRILGDDDEAKDIVQETMVAIWEKIRKIRSAEAFRTWMYRIVVNKCYDQIRKRNKRPEFHADEKQWQKISEIIPGGYSSQLENEEIATIIRVMTDRLSAKQKVVFVLSDLEEMTHDEISDITGMSKSVVKANLYHARRNISEMVEKYL
jgi:RNA polymerase sigma-70 factor, ECF subfamily